MLIFEYPFKDFLAIDRAVGAGELQGIVAWALSYRRFPIVELCVTLSGPKAYRVELRLFDEPNTPSAVIPFFTGPWESLDEDVRDTLLFCSNPESAMMLEDRWRARGESPSDLEATRAAWDYLAFRYLSTWEGDDDSEDHPRESFSISPSDREGRRSSFAPPERGADIEVMGGEQTICLLASSAIERAAVGKTLFAVDAEDLRGTTHWTVVDVGQEDELLVVREVRRPGESEHGRAARLKAWFAPSWIRDAKRLLDDAQEVPQVDSLLGGGFRHPIVGGTGLLRARPVSERGRELELTAVPQALIDECGPALQAISESVLKTLERLLESSLEPESGAQDGFDPASFVPRRGALVLAPGVVASTDEAPLVRGYRISGTVRCHGIERLLVLEWMTPDDAEATAQSLLEQGSGELRVYLVATTHPADELAALRTLQRAFPTDHQN